MKRLGLALLAVAVAVAGAALADDKPFAITLEARKMHEECVKLDGGEKRKYYWKADGPVDFNIHYHEGPEVFYPVKRDGMRTDGGIFAARAAHDYCWMWTARDKTVKIEGRIENK